VPRTLRRRTGEAKSETLARTGETGKLLAASVREAGAVVIEARAKAQALVRSRKAPARRKAEKILAVAERVQTLLERSEKLVELVSLFDPDARPIRKGKPRSPTEFGYVEQLAEMTPNTKRGTRGFILPPASAPGNPGENNLLPQTVAERSRLKGGERERTRTGRAVRAYNADTHGRYA